MKQFLLVLLFVFHSFVLFAQVGINTANTRADNSAMLDITSTNKGLLIPRMTTSLRSAITSPAKGLMVMDTTVNSLWYYNGTAWGELSSVNANLWNRSGNNIFNTNTGNIGIGTTTPDSSALLHVALGASDTKGFLVNGFYNSNSTIPDLGAGSRMMFYPGKAAFRAGYVERAQWNNSNVGLYSIATGSNTTASGLASTAMGGATTASDQYSTALGNGTTASNHNSTAMGYYTTASGFASTAMGGATTASGFYSTATGISTMANGYASTAAGNGTISKGYASTVTGVYNDSLLTTNQNFSNTLTSTTPLFIVGNGDSHTSRSNAMVVLKNGNVGIGKAPHHEKALLHIALDTSTTKGLLITGAYNTASSMPDLGAGTRMMFYPGKAAFRAGFVEGAQWNNSNVGISSTATGWNTIASGYASTAIGSSTEATGHSSTAIGYYSHASGGGSTALGGGTASGQSSIAMGSSTTASGDYSTAMGNRTTAAGQFSTAMGYETNAMALFSTSMGRVTNARGFASTAGGEGTIAKGYASTVTGLYNDSLLTTNQNGYFTVTSTTPLFIVGNGENNTTRSNAMIVRKDGNVGIGTNTPSARLHLKSNSAGNAVNSQLLLEEDGDDYTRLTMKNTSAPSRYWDMGAYNHNTNGSARLTFYYQGAGDILSLKGDGNATLMGTLTQNSDARLKKDIVSIDNAVHKIMQLNGYHYYWNDDSLDRSLQSGVLAQEVEKVMPELVKKDDKGILSVNYSGLVPVLIESVKEQQKEIDGLKARLEKLEKLLVKQ